jgi:DNA polymerase III epsilon subunit-like protein
MSIETKIKKYCVEYYSDVHGNGVKCFTSSEERDLWLHQCSIDTFYIRDRKMIDIDLDNDSDEKILFIDFETNGFSNKTSSGLSYFAKDSDNNTLERYFFPKEEYNEKAIAVNNLTEEVLLEKRGACNYEAHMVDDDGLEEFSKDVTLFVSYNVDFDLKWMPKSFIDRNVKVFCPMKFLTPIMKLTNRKRGGIKRPNLKEAAMYLGIEVDDEKRHDAKYDTEILIEIYNRIMASEDLKKYLK